mgnify:CR=1 FL=1
MFQNLRPTLVNLRKEILTKEKLRVVTGDFDEKIQLKLANELAIAFGYDLNRGRIDQAVHQPCDHAAVISDSQSRPDQ